MSASSGVYLLIGEPSSAARASQSARTEALACAGCPAGAKIRVLYGYGWFSKSRQEQTLDCRTDKKLEVGKWSVLAARMQIKVPESGNVNWAYVVDGPN